MKMTKEQRSEYRDLIREARTTLECLNGAVEHYSRVTEEAFLDVEVHEQEYEDAVIACEAFAVSMSMDPRAERTWGKFYVDLIDRRAMPESLELEAGECVEAFAMLEKKKK